MTSQLDKLDIFNKKYGTRYCLVEFMERESQERLDNTWNHHNEVTTLNAIEYLMVNGCKYLECIDCEIDSDSDLCFLLQNYIKEDE